MIKITHIRVTKEDKKKFVRFANKRKLTSSQAFNLIVKRLRL